MDKFSDSAMTILKERYFKRNKDGETIEDWDGLCKRVSKAIASIEKDKKWEKVFYDMIYNRDFLPNSPCLMNAGNELNMLSGCFVLPIGDSIEEIFEAVKQAALIHKSGGGCISGDAFVWSSLCGVKDIKSTVDCAIKDGRKGEKQGDGVSYNVSDLDIKTLSFNLDKNKDEFNKISHVWKFDVPLKDQIVIKTRDHINIQTSSRHPFFVFRNMEIKEIEACNLCEEDIVIRPDKNRDNWPIKKYQSKYGQIIDEDLAWLIGFTLGNGSFGMATSGRIGLKSGKRKRVKRVRWFSGTKDVIEKVQNILKRYDINVKITWNNRGSFEIVTHTQHFCNLLMDLCGIYKVGVKHGAIFIPEIITKSPINTIYSFVGGLIDSDGYIDERGRVSYSTVSKRMSDDLCGLLSILGFSPYIRNREPHGKSKLMLYDVIFFNRRENNKFISLIKDKIFCQHRLHRLKNGGENSGAIKFSYKEIRSILKKYGLIGNAINGSGPLAKEIGNLSCNLNGRCPRKDVLSIANCLDSYDKKISSVLRVIANRGVEILSVSKAKTKKDFYDFTVENTFNYAAGTNGVLFIHNTGFSFGRLRPKDSVVMSTKGISSGPVSFMKVFDSATEQIKQGSKRRGANIGILPIDHPDIEDFINCKTIEGKISNFNISIGVYDKFIDAYKRKGKFSLIDPHTKKIVKKVDAVEMMDKIAKSAWLNGEPGLIFLDRINKEHPLSYLGQIEACNPCGEVLLLPHESCCLGSINVGVLVYDGKFNWEKFKELIKNSIRFLDDIIDVQKYPLKKIKETTKSNRKIGLGIMGFADCLIKMGIKYGSNESYEFADDLATHLSINAFNESVNLAKERGPFPSFDKDKYWHKMMKPDEKIDGIRNACQISIAPTGSIAMIADCSYSLEPYFSVVYTKNIMDKSVKVVSPLFVQIAQERGFWSPNLIDEILEKGDIHIDEVPKDVQDLFVTTYELTYKQHLDIQSVFQHWVDNSISKSLNLINSTTVEDIKDIYLSAYDLNCKGVTVYRDGSRQEQVVETKKRERRQMYRYQRRPKKVYGTTEKIVTPYGKIYVTLNEDSEGKPVDCFISCKKFEAPMAEELLKSTAILISSHFRVGTPVKDLVKALKGVTGVGFFADREGSKKFLSIVDMIAKIIEDKYGEQNQVLDVPMGECPNC